MKEDIYEAIKVWAGKFTWHTGHPLDMRRFHEAVRNVYATCGSDIAEATFEAALRQHAKRNPVGMDGGPSEEHIRAYTNRAMAILEYLKDTK